MFSLDRQSFFGALIGIFTGLAFAWVADQLIADLPTIDKLLYCGLAGLLAASLFALTADRCELDGLFRSYAANIQQFCESLHPYVVNRSEWNPYRRLAVFVIPLAPGPLMVAVASIALLLGQLVYQKQVFPNAELTSFVVAASCAAALSVLVGWATADLRKRGMPSADSRAGDD